MTRPKKQYFFRKNSDFLFCAPKKGYKKAPAASKERTAPGRKQGKLQLCFGEALELRSAVGAADSLDRDLALAVGAFLGGGLLRLFHGLLVQHIDGLDGHEQHEGHDEEVDDRVDEFADLDAGTAQADHDIREICLEEQADQRVDDVIHQSRDDGRERTADDDTDCHIHDVSAHDKLFKLVDESIFFHLLLLLIFCFFSGEPRFFNHFQFLKIFASDFLFFRLILPSPTALSISCSTKQSHSLSHSPKSLAGSMKI